MPMRVQRTSRNLGETVDSIVKFASKIQQIQFLYTYIPNLQTRV